MEFMENTLQNRLPFIYIHGDDHHWAYDRNFFDLTNFLRITVEGRANEPPLLIHVDATGGAQDVDSAFVYDRQLDGGSNQ